MSRARRAISFCAATSWLVIGAGAGSAEASTNVTVPVGGNIQLALAQVAQAGGGTVTLESGTYYLTSSLTVWSNTTVVGQGSSTLLQDTPAAHGQGFQAAGDGESGITFEDFTIDGATGKNGFLSNSSGGTDNPNGGTAFYFWTAGTPYSNLTFDNITARHFGLGLFLGTVAGVTLDGDNFVDNNQVGNYAHDVYLVNCWGVSIDDSRFDYSGGDGLHMDFTSLGGDSISNSEFSHDAGEGVLWQGAMSGNSITRTATDYDGDNGLDVDSVNSSFNFDRGNYNVGDQLIEYGDGPDSVTGQYGFGNGGGFPAIWVHGVSLSDVASGSEPANTYWAAMADGVVGPYPTADWTSAYGSGTSGIGVVDFAGYPNGKLTFANVGATTTATTGATISYANQTSSTVTMGVSVNGQSAGTVSFPPTSAGHWHTVNLNLPLQSGNNVVVLSAQAGGAPVLDYLQVNTPVPSAPAAPANVTATATGPYQVDLTWSPVPGAQTYTVTRNGDTLATNITATHYSDQDIPLSGSTEGYVVTAVNQGGASPASAAVSATTPPDFPDDVSLSGRTVSWMSVNGATSYDVGRSTIEGGPYTVIANVPNTTSVFSTNFMQSYTDSSAASGTSYYYVVASVYGSGQTSPWSDEAGSSIAPVTVTPGDGQVTLTWAGGQADYQVTASPGGEACTTTGQTSCTVTGLTDGQTYHFTITGAGATANATATPYPASLMNQTHGLALWLDGADPSTEYTSPSCVGATAQPGQQIGCWADKSGGGESIANWQTGTEPELSSLSGLGAVSFASQAQEVSSLGAAGTYETVCLAAQQGAVAGSLGAPHVICAESGSPQTVPAMVQASGLASGLTAEVAEVVAFSRPLTAAELTTIESYLELKWDATLDTAATPVRTSAPAAATTTITIDPIDRTVEKPAKATARTAHPKRKKHRRPKAPHPRHRHRRHRHRR